MPTVLLVRHGRTHANATGVLAGWSPGVDLDDEGRAQARRAAERLHAVTPVEIVTSPLTRTLQTTDELRRGPWADVPVVESQQLGECRYGGWTGRPLSELAEDPLWKVVQQNPSAAVFPASPEFAHESIAQMAARAVAEVRAVDARIAETYGADAVWVAVSHGDVIKAVLADAAGTHLDLFQRFTVGPASVSVVRYTAERPYLLRVNDSGDDFSFLTPARVHSGAGVVGGGS